MKTPPHSVARRLLHSLVLFAALFAVWPGATPQARAGLTLEMNVIRYHQYGYYFFPNLNTNNTAPSVPFGDYLVTSFGYPTNGSWALYRFDSNGFNQNNGGSSGYGDFDGMMHELTNNLWSIFVTNSVTTNVYRFKVTANISSNDLPYVNITFPADGAVNVTNQPTYTWQGPTNYGGQVVYYYNGGQPLPVTQTSLLSPNVLYQGLNSFTAHYDSNSTTAVVASVPTNSAAQPISSWVSTAHLQDFSTSQFTVGSVDPLGTSHSLVARYAWDGTNVDGSASGADTSGNGYDLNFGGSFGSQGGTNSTTDPAVGPRAIQFHNGDGNSAGYVGWNPTPAALLTALSGSFTISCWIKTTQNNYGYDQGPAYEGAGIVSADNGGLANDSVPLALTGSKIGFHTGGDVEDVTLNSTAAVNDGNYHHIVVTRNQLTGQKIIYIDGVLDSFSSGSTNLLSDPQKLTLGALADASDPDPENFNYYNGYDGRLDDLQIYSGVLSSNEVANLFASPGSTTPDSSGGHQNVAHYAFEDGTSTFQLGVDSSPNANNLSGYSYWGQVHTNVSDAVAGTNAVEFFGTSSMNANNQVLTNLNEVLAGSFSFSAWVKTTASRGNDSDNAYFGATIFWAYNDHNNTNDTIPLAITGSKAAFTTRGGDSGASDTLHSITSVNDGNYHLITVTRDQATGEKKMYVDGNFESSEFGTTNPLNGNDYYLSIGGTVYSSYTGILDELQIYSGVLSAGDVAYLYANPGSVVADVTGSDFNAALNTTGLTWTTGGDSNWFVQTTNTHDNVSAARSGAITDDTQSSYLETTVTGPCTLSFWWQTEADDFDFEIQFKIDDNYVNNIYGNTSWTQETYPISAGQHTVKWVALAYDFIPATDAGYLDEVSFVPAIPPTITLNPFSQTNLPGYNIALLAAASTNNPVTWQWYKQNSFPVPDPSPMNLIPGATNAFYIPADSGTPNAGAAYFAIASNSFGSATTTVALVIYQLAALPPDWSRVFTSKFTNNPAHASTNINLAGLLDSAGNIYTVGTITGTNIFGTNILISPFGNESSSFLKQTAAGTPIWGRCMTNNGNGSSFPRGLAAAPGDGFYVSGSSYGTNWLGTNLLASSGGLTYLARFDANGSNLWLRTIVGTNGNFPTHHTLVSDPAGNVTVSVLISGYTSFGTTNFFTDGQKGVLAQYDSNGNVRWIQQPSAWPDGLSYSAGR
ncbi:MAG: LamG domain-containing protein, partial [Akkermansiaceae bacterium]|nr:LamG domain-containing protein [Verrucomicrobiales bacterium]